MKITKNELRQIILEEIPNIVENTDDQTRKISEEEQQALFDAANSGDPFKFMPAKDMDMGYLEQALGITVIGLFRGNVYVQPGINKGHHSGKPLYVLGKLLKKN